MAGIRTNNVSIYYVQEDDFAVLPGSPEWKSLEPNEISTFGATIATVRRDPISPDRQPRKGTITDLDSAIELGADITIDSFLDFAEGFMFAVFKGNTGYVPTAVTTGGYTVASGGDLPENTLIFARGFEDSANNGLKVVGSGSTSTNIVTTGLVGEATPPAGARVDVVGFRATTGDLEIDSSGDLISTALDFTTLNLTAGQGLYIGGSESDNQFATTDNSGLARVRVIETNRLVLDKRQQDYSTDDGAGRDIDIYFGPFVRNVSTRDADFAENSYQFEIVYPEVEGTGTPDGYEYAVGNYANELTISMPLSDKITGTFSFIGQDTESTTTTRKGGTRSDPSRTGAMNTTSDFLRLRLQQADETGLTTFFKNAEITINNNVTAEKVIAQLGAACMNFGNFNVSITTESLFTSTSVVAAVRGNETVGLDFTISNDDGALYFDIPSLSLGDGSKSFPVNETVRINLTGETFRDEFFGHSLGITHFPYLPE